MSTINVSEILDQVAKGTLDGKVAERMLLKANARKLRGVQVSAEEDAAYTAFVESGDFREFCATLALSTVGGQSLLGRITRAKFEKIG